MAEKDAKADKQRGVIYSLAPSFKSVETLWAGTDDGLIWVTRRWREKLEEYYAAGTHAVEQGDADRGFAF